MTDEKKKELFPYFAYLYSKEMNPEKYGNAESIEEWTQLIQNNKEDINKIVEAAEELTDEDWQSLEEQYNAAQNKTVELAAKGAKLKKLKNSVKKCKCGCDMINVKEKGGKIVSKCSCGCKPTVKANSGTKIKGPEITIKIDTPLTGPSKNISEMNKRVEKPQPELTFGQAFAKARRQGLSVFEWKGKKYTTQLKEEVTPAASPAQPVPTQPTQPTQPESAQPTQPVWPAPLPASTPTRLVWPVSLPPLVPTPTQPVPIPTQPAQPTQPIPPLTREDLALLRTISERNRRM